MVQTIKQKIGFAIVTLSFTVVCIMILCLLVTNKSHSEPLDSNIIDAGSTYGSYDTAKNIVQEVMRDYYFREDTLQYNYAKTRYGVEAPEAATSQKTLHSVCAAYAYDVYTEAFGMHYDLDKFPRYNYEVMDDAREYYENQDSVLDGHFLVYYEKPSTSTKYVYGGSDNFSDFASIIQPGDIFTFTGHVMMAYDKVCRESNTNGECTKWDVLMLHSSGSPLVRTRIDGTSKLYYGVFPSVRGNNNIIDVSKEGTIMYFWLSTYKTHFVDNNGNLSCKNEECAAIRPYYDDNGQARFNYKLKDNYYQKSLLRLEYPNLVIDKTSSIGTDNVVNIGDEITYTVKISNRSDYAYSEYDYDTFTIEEIIDNHVQFVSASNNGTYDNGKIIWHVNGLNSGDSVFLQYTVKVKNDISFINEFVTSTGSFYKDDNSEIKINIATINNKIVPKVSPKFYSNCYNESILKGKTSLELIDDVYKCVYNKDFEFDSFSFEEMFNKINVRTKGQTHAITLKDSTDERVLNYQNMIFNNYWSGLVQFTSSSNVEDSNSVDSEETQVTSKYTLPRWASDDNRNKIIKKDDFKNGDVLIYYVDYSETTSSLIHTNEDGIYAFIYINGKFVGVNGENDTVRNEFTYDYYVDNNINLNTHLYSKATSLNDTNRDSVLSYSNYQTLYDKDYYVILRPSLIVKELYSLEIDNLPTKLEYKKNSELLDVTGGKLKITYNDNSNEIIDMNDNRVTISGFDNSNIGSNAITLKYENTEVTFNVNIIGSNDSHLRFSDNIVVNSNTISGVEDNKKVSDFVSNIDTNGKVTVVNNQNEVIKDEDIVGTNSKVIIELDNEKYEYTIIVLGDNDGDGLINSKDLLNMRKHLLKEEVLTNSYWKASDINKDTKINSFDLYLIRKHLLGIKKIG